MALVPVTRARVSVGGVLLPATLRVSVDGVLEDASLRVEAEGGVVTPPPPPPPTGDRLAGMYIGNPGDNPDPTYFNAYGHYPMLTDSYYTSQTVNTAYETARVQRGTHLFADLDTKANAGMIVEVANWSATGQAYVDRFWAALEQVAQAAIAAGTGAKVWGAFCHEYSVKWQQLDNGTTLSGVAYTTGDRVLATYAAAASRFYARRDTIAPSCKTLYWMGGTWSGGVDAQIWPMMTTGCDGIAFDEYISSSNAFALPTADWQGVVDLIRGSAAVRGWNQGNGPSLHVGEFGIDDSHGDSRMAQYFADVPNAMAVHDITGVVMFSRDKTDPNGDVVGYDINTGATPLAKAAYTSVIEEFREPPTNGIAPNAATNLRTTATPGNTDAPIAWDAATVPAGGSPVTSYDIDVNGAVVRTVTGTSTTVTGLAAGTTYTVGVTPFNGLNGPRATMTVTTAGTTSSVVPLTGVSSTITNLGFDPDTAGAIDTASGMYVSRKNTTGGRVFWVHNDSGHASPTGTEDNVRVFAFDDVTPYNLLRNSLLTVNGSPVPIMDTEDMGWYFDGTNYRILVADIGLQGGTRATREIYRFIEPTVSVNQSLVTTAIPAERFVFNRPVSSIAPGTHDMEAMIVDTRPGPGLGDVYLFQKRGGTTVSSGSVWRAPASAFVAGGNDNMGNVFVEVATVPNIAAGDQNGITSADISEDGDHIYIKNYQRYWGWNRATGETIAACLSRPPDWSTGQLSDSQQEATAFDRGKTPDWVYGLGENVTATLKRRAVLK